jgi:hypothetical protein
VGELLDGSFFLYRKHFGRFLLVATAVSLPTLVLAGLMAEESADALRDYLQSTYDSVTVRKDPSLEDTFSQWGANMRFQVAAMIGTLLQSLSRGAAVATMAVATAAALNGHSMPGAREILRRSWRRAPAAILAYVSQAMMGVALLPLLCCLPIMVIITVLLTPVPALVMFERGPIERELRGHLPGGVVGLMLKACFLPLAQVIDATLRSFVLGWHAATIARGTSFVFFLLLFVSFFVSGVAGAVAGLFDSGALFFWLNHYCEVVFLPIVGISITLWYVDLRVRREAVDLIEGEIALA